jgi:hypothetical protein
MPRKSEVLGPLSERQAPPDRLTVTLDGGPPIAVPRSPAGDLTPAGYRALAKLLLHLSASPGRDGTPPAG